MHTNFQPVLFFGMTDLVVVGTNPEMADFDNPRGEIIRSAAYVCAEDAKGYRRRYYLETGFERDVAPIAEEQAACLMVRLQKFGKLPIGFKYWDDFYPAYGSEAYIESDQGGLDAYMDRMEEEMFA